MVESPCGPVHLLAARPVPLWYPRFRRGWGHSSCLVTLESVWGAVQTSSVPKPFWNLLTASPSSLLYKGVLPSLKQMDLVLPRAFTSSSASPSIQEFHIRLVCHHTCLSDGWGVRTGAFSGKARWVRLDDFGPSPTKQLCKQSNQPEVNLKYVFSKFYPESNALRLPDISPTWICFW